MIARKAEASLLRGAGSPKARLRGCLILLILLFLFTVPTFALSDDEVREVALSLADEAARAEILEYLDQGADISFTYDEKGQVTAYRIELQTQEKYFRDMSEEEKAKALNVLVKKGKAPSKITVNGKEYGLNLTRWSELGILVYGNAAEVNAAVSATSSPNYDEASGQYRYWGFDRNGGLYANYDFPRDADSGREPWEKDWMTAAEIRTNSTARGYVGDFALSVGFSLSQRRATAEAFLAQNPGWISAGMDADYILEHFYFNAVTDPEGLTVGQFIGVHGYDGRLWYQVFLVETPLKLFTVVEGTILDRDIGEERPEPPLIADISGEAHLTLPEFTYEGHPTDALDQSLFFCDGEIWSAAAVYKAGLGHNSFSVQPSGVGRVSTVTDTLARVTFNQPGDFSVRLRVFLENGAELQDEKPITVRPTPWIESTLSGTQKENRKQTLGLQVMTHPDYPLTKLWVEIKRTATGEVLHLDHDFSASTNALKNSDSIKTRSLRKGDSSQYQTDFLLDFLTKNTVAEEFQYTVYTKDSRGHEHQITQIFIVQPDLAPAAAISLDPAYVRDEGSNHAVITAADSSVSDDDVIRTWSVAFSDQETSDFPAGAFVPLTSVAGYGDLSFGSGNGQQVKFQKTGVGSFALKLYLRDSWKEPTLEEYITAADYKTAEVTAISEVINIAPVVSLSLLDAKKASLLFLAENSAEYEALSKAAPQVRISLMEQGIAGDISVERILPASSVEGARPREHFSVEESFGYEGGSTFLEGDSFLVDDENLYTISGSWNGTNQGKMPQYPYTITAYDGSFGEKKWNYTLTEETMPLNTSTSWGSSNSRFAADQAGRYLFFRNGSGKTLVLARDTGAFLTVLDFEVGDFNTSGPEAIYSFKSDGIWRIHAGTGAVTKIHGGNLSADKAGILSGKVHFLQTQVTQLSRGVFDPDTERVTLYALPGAAGDDPRNTYTLLGIDSEGKMIVHSMLTKKVNDSNSYNVTIRFYGSDNDLLGDFQTQWGSGVGVPSAASWAPVWDGSGLCSQVVRGYKTTGGSYYYHGVVRLYEMDGSYLESRLSSNVDMPTTGNILYAQRSGNEVIVATGGIYTYVFSYSYSGYAERAATHVFDLSECTTTQSLAGILTASMEYATSSDTFTAFHFGDNSPYETAASHTTVVSRPRTLDQNLTRYIRKCLDNESDINGVVYLSPGTVGQPLSLAESAASSLDADLHLLVSGEKTPEDLAEEIAALFVDAESKGKLLALTPGSSFGGSLSTTISLDPGKEYYYEYQWKSSGEGNEGLSVTLIPEIETNFADPGENWYVSEVQFEDFEDNDLNPFFSLSADKVYEGAYFACDHRGNNSEAYSWSQNHTISFTVPAGKKALLSFDYNIARNNVTLWDCGFATINGQRWDLFQPEKTSKGSYTFKEFLPEGKNTITFRTCFYGRQPNDVWFAADNLKVAFLEDSPPAAKAPEVYAKLEAGGWTSVTGQIQMPESIISYGQIPAGHYTAAEADAKKAGYLAWAKETNVRGTYTLNLPEGKTMLRTLLATTSKSYEGYANPMFVWGDYSWANHPDSSNRVTYAGTDIGSPFDIYLPAGISGVQKIQRTSAEQYAAWAKLDRIDLLWVDEMTEPLAAGQYFYDENTEILYGAREDFTGEATLSLQLPGLENTDSSPICYIKNLAIYTMDQGVKKYVWQEAFEDSLSLADWTVEGLAASVVPEPEPEKEEPPIVYEKGETVVYGITYSDYEKDPSKKQYWKYTHTPFNDGPHPQAAVILDEEGQVIEMKEQILSAPITKFYVDGKYTVEHWQEDNTASRRGLSENPDYDKLSNVASLTFYIEGGTTAPRITYIKTDPAEVNDGDNYRILVGVADEEGDTLRLDVEVNKEGKIVFTHKVTGLKPNSIGKYPEVITPWAPDPASPGIYEVVCTVRDETSVGMDSYRFAVVSTGKVTGWVNHTEEWDQNRKKYNLARKEIGEEVNRAIPYETYLGCSKPRPRGTNVFWSGERFELEAAVAGNPLWVRASILNTAYSAILTRTSSKNAAGEAIWSGSLWDNSMINKWGRKNPEQLVFRFEASYGKAGILTFDVPVIMDSETDYWQLHRLW